MKKIFYQIGFNTFIQILGKGISLILGFVTVGLLTRYLGQEGFGNFSLAFAYFSIFGTIADWGLQLTMVRELAKKKNLPKEIYGTYFWLKVMMVLISTLLAIICLLFFPYSKFLKIGIIFASLGAAVGVLNTYGTVIFQANLRLDLVTLVDVFTKIITTIFIVIFVFLKFGFYSIINTILIGNLAGSILMVFLLKKFIAGSLKFDLSLAKKLLVKSLPVGFLTILSFLYFKIDTIVLSLYRGAGEVGIYSLAYKVLENILALWGFYMATVYPLLANFIKSRKNYQVKHLWQRSVWVALGSSALIIFLGYIFAPLVIRVLGGEEFHLSVRALRILLFSVPLFFINNLFYYTFLIEEKMRVLITAIISSLVINLVLNLIFIPEYGYLAAAFNTIITEIYLLVLYFAVSRNFFTILKTYE